jgi:hypothetical protein
MKSITIETLDDAARIIHDTMRNDGNIAPSLDKAWVLLNEHERHYYREMMKRALWVCAIVTDDGP